MIVVVDALNRHLFTELLDEMFKLRKRVFHDRLGWDVNIEDGKEIDEFDRINPAYLICLDEEGDVVGCLRLLQTTGPHMLADVFSDILQGEAPPRSSQLWEVTRFCIDSEKLRGGKKRNSVSYVTTELFIAATEFGKNNGICDAIAVIDPLMNRVMIRSQNAPYDYVGKTVQMGKVKAMAGLLDCTDERINRLREFASIHHNVFATEEAALDHFNNRPSAPQKQDVNCPDISATDLLNYCNEQIASATSDQERKAAYSLALELAELTHGRGERLVCDA